MTTFFRGFCALSFVAVSVSAAGCGLFKKGGDTADAEAEAGAVAEVAEAAPPPVVLPAATNENDISRFPDEKKLENVTGTLLRVTNVREIPGIGKIVTSLAKGGTVTEIAQRGTFFLVVFEKDSKKLMGWISQDSFTAQPAFDASVAIKCNAPDSALVGDTAFCGKVCTADTDCVAGQRCKGAANRLLTNGGKGDAVTVCTIFGAPAAVVTPATPVTPIPPPPVVVQPKCGAGTIFVAQDKQCHRSPCKIGQCPADSPLCINCSGASVCVPVGSRSLCK